MKITTSEQQILLNYLRLKPFLDLPLGKLSFEIGKYFALLALPSGNPLSLLLGSRVAITGTI